MTEYLNGAGMSEHLGELSTSGAKAYVTDHLGSILNSEVAGSSKAFGVFGEVLSVVPPISLTSNPVSYGWQGLRYDRESGLWDNGPRALDPNANHFLQKDPIGFLGGDANLYRSRSNNPLSYIDPSGLKQVCDSPGATFKTIGLGVNGTFAVGAGGSVGGGIYFGVSDGGVSGNWSPTGEGGVYVSGGQVTGVNVGAGVVGTVSNGGVGSFGGPSISVDVSAGPIQGSVFGPPGANPGSAGSGFSGSVGGGLKAGGSITAGGTVAIPVTIGPGNNSFGGK